MDKIIRLVSSIDALALANGITERHHLDTLVGIAARALADGKRDMEALEAARQAAKHIHQIAAARVAA